MYKLRQLISLFRYDIPRFIKNVFVYRKALWLTFDFDYGGSLYYLQKHLERLEPQIRTGYHVHGEKVANKVKTCRLLLDRILNHSDQYFVEDFEVDFSGRTMKIIRTPKNTEHPRRETKTYIELEKNREEQDWKLLMKLLTKHQRSFWD